MKTPALPLRISQMALAVFALASSSSSLAASSPATEAATVHWRDPADPGLAEHLAEAKLSLQLLVTTLADAVANAVKDGGPHQGVIGCQLQALPLTHQSLRQSPPRITALKRTSLRLRNPANTPDAPERLALNRVAQLIDDKEPVPPFLVQELDATATHDAEIRIYKPVTIAAQCLTCHGNPSTFPARLSQVLAQRYPTDAATGYREGDWRGLIRVSLAP